MKFYLIMKFTFASEDDAKKWKKAKRFEPAPRAMKEEYAQGDGSQGTNGNPDNHFPSIRIKMHELQKAETDKRVVYRVLSTNY